MELLNKAFNIWQPGISDPSLMGWLTVLLYLCGTYLSWTYACNFSKTFPLLRYSYENLFWHFITIFLFFLAVNKQLDLQTFLILLGKEMAKQNSWYKIRRTYQLWFIISIIIASTGLLTLYIYILKDVLKKYFLAVAGMALLFVFILLRAVSFHHIDWFIKLEFLGFQINWILELSGIILIYISSIQNIKNLKANKKP